LVSRHGTGCGCLTRIDGSVAHCPTHRLEVALTDLATAYSSLCEGLADAHDQGGRRNRARIAVPVNLSVLELASGWYEDGDGTNQPGVAPTAVRLEQDLREALGEEQVARPRRHEARHPVAVVPAGRGYRAECPCTWKSSKAAHPVQLARAAADHLAWAQACAPDSRVIDAIGWLTSQAARIAVEGSGFEWWADQIREHCWRLTRRAQLLLEGPRWQGDGIDTCPVCREPGRDNNGTVQKGTFPSGDGTGWRRVAMCTNGRCADDVFPGRPCWQWDELEEEWVRIPMPAPGVTAGVVAEQERRLEELAVEG
jgi:hypothetical protein